MGMFDDKKYLTGDSGEFKVGDTFTLNAAEIAGTVNIRDKATGQDKQRKEAKLTVTKDGETEPITVYTTGMAITGAIERMSPGDLPARVKLDNKTTNNGQAHILVKA